MYWCKYAMKLSPNLPIKFDFHILCLWSFVCRPSMLIHFDIHGAITQPLPLMNSIIYCTPAEKLWTKTVKRKEMRERRNMLKHQDDWHQQIDRVTFVPTLLLHWWISYLDCSFGIHIWPTRAIFQFACLCFVFHIQGLPAALKGHVCLFLMYQTEWVFCKYNTHCKVFWRNCSLPWLPSNCFLMLSQQRNDRDFFQTHAKLEKSKHSRNV